MTLRYIPDPDAVRLADRTLHMRIDMQAVIAAIEEEREKYQQKTAGLLEWTESIELEYLLTDDVDDDQLEKAQEMHEMILSFDANKSFQTKIDHLETVRNAIHTKQFSDVTAESLKDIPVDIQEDALHSITDIALWQAYDLLELDKYTQSYLFNQAQDIILDRLGFTK
ncbi:MAG: hypothetical protein JWM56_1301 [Candidatus Peribacteria bacterium]|nr:hypothetical protein [Candidatus Peribacteria bacterium]